MAQFGKTVVGRNITVISNEKIDHVWSEYGEIVRFSEITNGIDKIDNFCNESNNEKVPDKKRSKYHISFLTDNDVSLSV